MPPKTSAYMLRARTLMIIFVLRVRAGHGALHARPEPGAEPVPAGQGKNPDRGGQAIRSPCRLHEDPGNDPEDAAEDDDETAARTAHGFVTVFRLERPYRPDGTTH